MKIAPPANKLIEKSNLLEENLNKAKPAANSEKVPEEATRVFDDKKIEKELMDLKKQLREVFRENDELNHHIDRLQVAKRDITAKTDEELTNKRKQNEENGFRPSRVRNKLLAFKNEDIPDYA